MATLQAWPDHGMDRLQHTRRASGDHRRKQVKHHQHLWYDDSNSEKLGCWKQECSDEWDYIILDDSKPPVMNK